jgi:hypothetical protein
MHLPMPVELNDAELDAVAAGAQGNGIGGLIGVGVAIDRVVDDSLNNNKVTVSLLNGNDVRVSVAALANVLGVSKNDVIQAAS